MARASVHAGRLLAELSDLWMINGPDDGSQLTTCVVTYTILS